MILLPVLDLVLIIPSGPTDSSSLKWKLNLFSRLYVTSL